MDKRVRPENKITLIKIKRTDEDILKNMSIHYSKPKGFVGRNICYAVYYSGVLYGHIVSGSATKFLSGRNEFFGNKMELNKVINNIFYHIEKRYEKYPIRNFTSAVLKIWREKAIIDWKDKYGDNVIGFESLIEIPRTGECYRKDGWIGVGKTKGFTCKRVGGKGTDSWSGKRIWDTKNLRPKLVFVRKP